MFNKFILFVAVICMAGKSYAQMPCGTDEHYQRMLQVYPQLANYEEQFNAQLRRALEERTTSATDTTIYDIPLVVHVIHDYGVENVADTVIYQAAKDWATIYMEQNADTMDVITPFKNYIGNPRIRLHLATIDPNGNPTKGVVRVHSYLTMNADDEAKYGSWAQNKYVNIWLINTFGEAEAGAAAYAYFPSSAAYQPYYDGVICLSSYTDYAKTIPHEIGHVLNLEHPWGNTNQPNVACGDDGVDDTPPTKGHLTVGCTPGALFDTSCAGGYHKTYLSSDGHVDSLVNYPDTVNSQNIMDYTYCQKMFTKGQVVRMRTALLSSTAGRNNLYSSSNLAATGALAPMPDLAPIADFSVNKATGGGVITDAHTCFLTANNAALFSFKNWSWNDTVSSVAWTFSNGATSPTSASLGTVTQKFAQPGWVTVSLTANSNAGTNTITNTQTVYVADTNAVGGYGYTQSFASAADISNWPMINYYGNQFKWNFFTGAGYNDNTCIKYQSYDTSTRYTGEAIGDHDDFFTPAFNLTTSTDSLYLNFYTAAAAVSSSSFPYGVTVKSDSLEIDFSVTGGQRWTKLAAYTGNDLDNNGVKSANYTPVSPSEWKGRTVRIPAADRTAQTFFRFRYWPGTTGNNLYMDNFSIGQFTAGVKESLASSDNTFTIFPNPASNGFNLVFKTGIDGAVNYSIKDITGKLVYEHKTVLTPNAIQQEAISRSATPSAGMYFVTVTIDGVNMTQKLVVY